MKGIAMTNEVCSLLDNNSPVAIGVSGGKDSHAVAFRVSEYLDEIAHTGPRLLIHSDLGRIEWRDSMSVCERIARNLNLELVVVRRKSGDLIDRWQKRWQNNVKRYLDLSCVKLILPWSTPAMRFCTSELKTSLICSKLLSLFPDRSIVSVTGIRAEESSSRAKMPFFSHQPKLSRRDTAGFDWRPILHWTKDDVFSYLASKGETLHQAYTRFGCSRVSCSFCIMSSLGDLKASAACADNHDIYRLLVGIEVSSTFAFQGNRWLGDIAPHLLDIETVDALAGTKEKAKKRINAESLIPKHMLFTKGWPEALPTRAEAQLLGRVRKIVCESIAVQPTLIDADEIITRYRELMAVRPMISDRCIPTLSAA